MMIASRLDLVFPAGGGRLETASRTTSRDIANVVALTFDDGPDLNDILLAAMLRERGARGTFFYLGSKLRSAHTVLPEVSGHEIGSHSFNHPYLTTLSPDEQLCNLQQAQKEFRDFGIVPGWFRPPYGDYDDGTIASARFLKMHTLMWNVDSLDWNGLDSDAVTRRVVDRLEPGAVVLMHSIQSETVRAMPAILDAVEAKGLRMVTATEWFRQVYQEPHP